MRVITTAALASLLTVTAAAAQTAPKPAADQIAAAVQPLPEEFRATATVLGYEAGKAGLTQLRAGTGAFICLADDPADERVHVACYHSSLEAFMARGRELRASGITGPRVDSARFAEINSGRLAMPKQPATLYSMTGERRLYVVYIPFATSESTGLPKSPSGNMPWIMFPGTPKAHIMFTPTMQ